MVFYYFVNEYTEIPRQYCFDSHVKYVRKDVPTIYLTTFLVFNLGGPAHILRLLNMNIVFYFH
jgi:hypothetical protein